MPKHFCALLTALLASATIGLVSPVAGATSAVAQDAPESIALLVEQAPLPKPMSSSPDIGSLTLESDFTVFMKQDCPEELRLQALRRLWTLLPQAAPVENSAI